MEINIDQFPNTRSLWSDVFSLVKHYFYSLNCQINNSSLTTHPV